MPHTFRDDDVLALEPAAILLRETFFGTNRLSGGYFENVILGLYVFAADGRCARSEIFEPDHEAEALARFDVVVAAADDVASPVRAEPPFANLATSRSGRRSCR